MTTNLGPWPGNLYPPVRAHATANITPFTYYDGLSFLEVLEALRAWLRETLIPGLDGIIEIIDGMIQDALESVEIDLEAMRQELNDALASIELTDTELRAYVDDVLQQVINNSIELQDAVLAGILRDPESETSDVIDDVVFALVTPDRTVYVSSEGDDAGDGLIESRPVASIERAVDVLGVTGGTIKIRDRDTIVCNSLLSLTLDRHRLIGNASTLDFSEAPNGNCITWNGNNSQVRSWEVMSGIIMLGKAYSSSEDTAQTALFINGSSAAYHVANSNFNNIAIREFETGVNIGDNCWDVTFGQSVFRHCATAVKNLSGTVNSGALIKFTDCRLFQCGKIYEMSSSNGTLLFTGCSWSHSSFGVQTRGQVTLVSCQLETNLTKATPFFEFSGAGTAFAMIGGSLAATPPPRETPILILNNCPYRNAIVFRDVEFHEFWGTTGNFANGTGLTQVTGEAIIGGGATGTWWFGGSAANLVPDSRRTESDTWPADWYIHADATTPTTRSVTGDNGRMIEASGPRTDYSQKVVRLEKSASTGQPFTTRLMVPVTHRAGILHFSIPYQKFAGTGSMSLSLQAVAVTYDGGYPNIKKSEVMLTMPVVDNGNGTSAAYNTFRNTAPAQRVPMWATHLVFQVNLAGASSGTAATIGPPYITLG